jgi:NhaC family Na+:H+ antiporter
MAIPQRKIPVSVALIPVVFLISALAVGIILFKQPPHIPLILATTVAAFIALLHGYYWKQIREGAIQGILIAMDAVLILLIVGTMIGTWILGGIVPTMIYYGLKLLSPSIFLIATLLICSIVALGTGSSWSTAGTVGVALVGIGRGLGIPVSMVAGAIVSGAYFGDKMSPLSDTTNLAPAVAGSDLFGHIRHMLYTTIPSYCISIILFGLLGIQFSSTNLDTNNIELMLSTMDKVFFIHPVLLFPPCLVIFMVIKRTPPLPSLFAGTLFGAICAVLFQKVSFAEVFQAAFSGYLSNTGLPVLDTLLNRGGLMNMMETIALIYCALAFGGIMEKTGMLEILANSLLKRVHRTGSLIATTLLSSIGINAIAPNQYMSIIIPGRMYRNKYKELGLHPVNLSRCLEDAGTLTSPLIPWNSCGAFMHITLGVNPLLYLPYAFLNLANPIVSLIYGYTGITIKPEKNPSHSS